MESNLQGPFLLNNAPLAQFSEMKAPVCQYSVQNSFYKLSPPGLGPQLPAGTPHGITDILSRPVATPNSSLLSGYPHVAGFGGLGSQGVYYSPQVGNFSKAATEYPTRTRNCWADAGPDWRGGRQCGNGEYAEEGAGVVGSLATIGQPPGGLSLHLGQHWVLPSLSHPGFAWMGVSIPTPRPLPAALLESLGKTPRPTLTLCKVPSPYLSHPEPVSPLHPRGQMLSPVRRTYHCITFPKEPPRALAALGDTRKYPGPIATPHNQGGLFPLLVVYINSSGHTAQSPGAPHPSLSCDCQRVGPTLPRMPVRGWRRWQDIHGQVTLTWEAGSMSVAAGAIPVPRSGDGAEGALISLPPQGSPPHNGGLGQPRKACRHPCLPPTALKPHTPHQPQTRPVPWGPKPHLPAPIL